MSSLTRRGFMGGAVGALGMPAFAAAEKSKPADLSADILVAGGGTAGTAAAIAAARRGHKVLLVEEDNCLGGTSTTGGVCEWFASQEGLGDIFDRVRRDLKDHGALLGARHFNSEILKLVWQLMAEEAGVSILFHGSVIGARTENQTLANARATAVARAQRSSPSVSEGLTGGRIARAEVVSCSRKLNASARFFIDATGEGDLAAAAGAPFMKGDPEHGYTLHMTLTFVLHDTGKPVKPHLPHGLEEIKSAKDLPGLGLGSPLGDGRIYCNSTKVMLHDPTDPLSLSKAELEARRQLARVVHYVQRTKYPNYALCASGARIGIREGRRIIGEHVLTGEEILGGAARGFEDGVAVATSQIDFHSLTRAGNLGWRQKVDPYPIPLRCLVVKGLANLLTAGKCISGDQVAQSSYRMTPTCCAMGQAAGTAAALALENKLSDLRQLDAKILRKELAAAGMELDPSRHKAFAPQSTPKAEAK